MAGSLLLLRLHILNLREDRHSLSAIVDALQIMIIQIRIIREHGWENALDRERAAHRAVIIIAAHKRYQQIDNIAFNPKQVLGQIRKLICQFLQSAAFKGFVICCDAYIRGDIPDQRFRNAPTRVLAGGSQKFTVLYFAAWLFNVMQRILERYLLIGGPGNKGMIGCIVSKSRKYSRNMLIKRNACSRTLCLP